LLDFSLGIAMSAVVDTIASRADALLILFYRITGNSLVDYFLGTTILAFVCVVLGELSVSLAIRFNRRHLKDMSQEMKQKERLSIDAYESGDKTLYQTLNKEATDAWGKHFFTMVAYSAGVLWPIPFALAWMQTRFHGIDFPLAWPLSMLLGGSVGYTFSFIPLYILCRIVFKYMRPWLPYFRGVQRLLDASK